MHVYCHEIYALFSLCASDGGLIFVRLLFCRRRYDWSSDIDCRFQTCWLSPFSESWSINSFSRFEILAIF